MSKVPKVPLHGTPCPYFLVPVDFQAEATHTASQTPVQLPGPFPIDPACSAAWESSLSQLLGADKELPRSCQGKTLSLLRLQSEFPWQLMGT